jgi:hypothetical protein
MFPSQSKVSAFEGIGPVDVCKSPEYFGLDDHHRLSGAWVFTGTSGPHQTGTTSQCFDQIDLSL